MEQERTEYNLTKLKDLTGNDNEAMKHFAELFVEHTVGKDLPELKEKVNDEDWSTVRQIAHRMKASIDLFGIDLASKAIRSIEEKGKTQLHTEDLLKETEALEAQLLRVREPLLAALNT